MSKQLKNKNILTALIAPAYAALELKPPADNAFRPLADNITASGLISGFINLVLIVSTVVFFFILIIGSLKWITSSGDEKKLATARASITHGAIGLGIVFIAWALMSLIGNLFDFNPFKLQITPFTNGSSSSGSSSSGGGNPPIIKQPSPTRIVPQYTQ
jgi:hypothetical protein